ncbi:MAG: hypothetical protein ACRBFS_20915 [Aureispira sp.]
MSYHEIQILDQNGKQITLFESSVFPYRKKEKITIELPTRHMTGVIKKITHEVHQRKGDPRTSATLLSNVYIQEIKNPK